MRTEDRVPAALTVLVVLMGGWLRWQLLDGPYRPDEFANLFARPAWQALWDAEAAVNPPLLRALANGVFPTAEVIDGGRRWMWFCGTASVGAAFFAGRVAARSSWAGLVAALLVAFYPPAVEMSARFRIYPAWQLVGTWHVTALMLWASDEDQRRRWGRHVVASAVLLPWLHYFAVPLLALLGSGLLASKALRRGFLLYVPAGLAILPMAPLIVGETSARVASPHPLVEVLVRYASAGLLITPPSALRGGFVTRDIAEDLAGAAVVFGLLVGLALSWRRLDVRRRLLVWACTSCLITVAALSQLQFVRSPTRIMMWVFLAPLLASLPWWPASRWARGVFALLLVTWPPAGARTYALSASRFDADEGLRTLSLDVHKWDLVRGGRPMMLHPTYAAIGLQYYLEGTYSSADVDCEGWGRCFDHDGTRFIAVPEHGETLPRIGLLVSVEHGGPPARLVEGCTPVDVAPVLGVWDCGR